MPHGEEWEEGECGESGEDCETCHVKMVLLVRTQRTTAGQFNLRKIDAAEFPDSITLPLRSPVASLGCAERMLKLGLGFLWLAGTMRTYSLMSMYGGMGLVTSASSRLPYSGDCRMCAISPRRSRLRSSSWLRCNGHDHSPRDDELAGLRSFFEECRNQVFPVVYLLPEHCTQAKPS